MHTKGHALYSWTFDQVSGIKIAHDTVIEYLYLKGFNIYPIYNNVVLPPSPPWLPLERPRLDLPLYTTWYFGRAPSYTIAYTDIPLVIWHGFVEGVPGIPKELIELMKDKVVFVAPSMFVKEMLSKIGIHTNTIFNPGVMPFRLLPDITRTKILREMKKGKKMLCYIADNQPRKGIPLVIEAYRIVRREGYRDTMLYILTSHRMDIPRDLPENTVLDLSMFMVSDTYVASIYHACDVYVHGAMSEGLGLPIMEAQYVGLPVVIVDAPPMNEVCIDRWCYRARWRRIEWYDAFGGEVKTIKHVYEPDDLAEAIIRALNDEWDRRYISEQSRKYEFHNTLRGFENFVSEVIEEMKS